MEQSDSDPAERNTGTCQRDNMEAEKDSRGYGKQHLASGEANPI